MKISEWSVLPCWSLLHHGTSDCSTDGLWELWKTLLIQRYKVIQVFVKETRVGNLCHVVPVQWFQLPLLWNQGSGEVKHVQFKCTWKILKNTCQSLLTIKWIPENKVDLTLQKNLGKIFRFCFLLFFSWAGECQRKGQWTASSVPKGSLNIRLIHLQFILTIFT